MFKTQGPKTNEVCEVIDYQINPANNELYYQFKEYPPDQFGERNYNCKHFKPVQDDLASAVLEKIAEPFKELQTV